MDKKLDKGDKKMTKRMRTSLIMGALLGVVCIIGSYVRSNFQVDLIWMFSLWYNRLLMGFILGLPLAIKPMKPSLVRGALIGLIVSFAFYSSTGFVDFISFVAGIIYGIIIEYVLVKVR